MKKLIILITCIFFMQINFARESVQTAQTTVRKPSLHTRGGDCNTGRAQVDLDVNNVRAKLLNTGDMWWDRQNTAKYGVPKISASQEQQGVRQVTALFAGSIWISGKDNGNLKIAAIRFSTGGAAQFWTGPIKQGDATIDNATCNKFDDFWEVKGDDIANAIANISISESIKKWPGKGNQELANAGKFSIDNDLNEDLAPFYDKNGNGIYEPLAGDVPSIKYINGTLLGAEPSYADQMIFWVLNDVGNAHVTPDGTPIGVQVNCLAFAFASTDELNNMTFYTYKVIKKTNGNLDESYISQFADCDMGNALDDYVGCDTTRGLGYCVNADALDDNNPVGYLENVPIVGIDFFEGPKVNGKQLGMTSFSYFLNENNTSLSDPNTDTEHRNVQEGKSRLGTAFTSGGNCITGTKPTKFCFPGNPFNSTEWSMCSASLLPKDIRFVQNSGPFILESGIAQTVTVGVIFVQPPVGSYSGCNIDVAKHLFPADEKAQKLFDYEFKSVVGPEAANLNIREGENQLFFNLESVFGGNNYGETYSRFDPSIPNGVKDSTYKFEGYLIYQVFNPSDISNLSDLENINKARLIKEMDIKNSVPNTAINASFIIVNGDSFKNIDRTLALENKGISHSFIVNEDKFEQEGRKNLVNNKTYHYAIIAFAYNNYYNPVTNSKQLTQLKFSKEIKLFSAIPHDNSIFGLKPKANFGQGIPVTRVQGLGHGNYFLDILASDEAEIVSNYSKDVLTYKGSKSPINVYVNDPYKIKPASFELTLADTSHITPNKKFNPDSTIWTLKITGGDDIVSETNIARPYDQSIYGKINSKLESYGISIGISLADSINVVNRNGNAVYRYIGGELKYDDEDNKWINLLADLDDENYKDWIRSGAVKSANSKFNSAYNRIGGKLIYTDPNKEFAAMIDKRVAPYCLTANNSILSGTGSAAEIYSSYGPGFKWKRLSSNLTIDSVNGNFPENNLDSIFSCDIVLTKDPTKWSRCIVLETGESPDFQEFNALKGQIRKAPSKGIDMLEDGEGEGLSYFPGYAINLETGTRVNVHFGENSRNRGTYAANMIFDPSSDIVSTLGSPSLGGGHFVYVTNTKYDIDELKLLREKMITNFNKTIGTGTSEELSPEIASIYRTFIYSFIPIKDSIFSFYNSEGKYSIPNDIRIKIRVQKPYSFYLDGTSFTSIYKFSTDSIVPETKLVSQQNSAFENARIVPNPYNAYSIYENSGVQNIVKIVDVPNNCTVSIYTTDGILVRRIKQDVTTNIYGANNKLREIPQENAITWDMRTSAGVSIASGVYYIHVESPDLGSKVLKLFATMRSADVSNF